MTILCTPGILSGGAFDPATLFASSEVGDWWLDGTRYQDSAKTTLAGVGDPVGAVVGTVNGTDLIQATSARRPTAAADSLLTFGGAQGLYSASNVAWGSNVVTLVFSLPSITVSSFSILCESGVNPFLAVNQPSFSTRMLSGEIVAGVVGSGGDSLNRSEQINTAISSGGIVRIELNNSTSSSDIRIWVGENEVATTIITNTASGTGNYKADVLNFGARDAGGTLSAGFPDDMALVLAIDRELTSAEWGDIRAEVTRVTGIS